MDDPMTTADPTGRESTCYCGRPIYEVDLGTVIGKSWWHVDGTDNHQARPASKPKEERP